MARLPVLYRSALSSLSVARAISLDRSLAGYLEGLCARAHFAVYGIRQRFPDALRLFVAQRFPRAVRSLRIHLLVAALLLAVGTLTSAAQTLGDPDRFGDFVELEYSNGRDPSATTTELRAALYSSGEEDSLAVFSSWLFSHNARIGVLCFALGFAAGLPVFLLLFQNGLVLGAFAALYGGRGLGMEFWGWVLPHGVTELFAMLLCAAAGLGIAESIIFPGRYSRVHALAARGREAAVVVVGAIALFFVAGAIEGFFRQLVHGLGFRYAVAGGTALFWVAYFTRAGRRP